MKDPHCRISISRYLVLAVLLCLAVGCTRGTPTPSATPVAKPVVTTAPVATVEATATKPSSAAYPVTVTDGLQRSVTFTKKPLRIISLAPKNTEILFAMGLGDQIVGNTTYCNYPPAAKDKEKIGGFSARAISLEKVIALKPDVVLAAGDLHRSLINELERLEIPVLALDAESLDDLCDEFELLGRVTQTEQVATTLATDLRQRIAAVKSIAAKIPEAERATVLYVAWDEPLTVAGPTSYIGQLISFCGARNVVGDTSARFPQVSQEVLLARNPTVIIAPAMASVPVTVDSLKAKTGWSQLRAIQEGRVYVMDGDMLSRCGPRLADALEQMAHEIYPDRFPSVGQTAAANAKPAAAATQDASPTVQP